MRKLRLLLLSLFLGLATTSSVARIRIHSGERYRIACAYQPAGAIVLGTYHNAAPYVYYLTGYDTVPDDAWWVITQDGKGYTIANCVSGQYLTYCDVREKDTAGNYLSKGLVLRDALCGDSARWTFEQVDGNSAVVYNIAAPEQSFNLRKDGTYLMGTYNGTGSSNCYFLLYDTDGESAIDDTEEPTTTVFSDYLDSLRLNGKDVVYDGNGESFYLPISQKLIGGGTPVDIHIETRFKDDLSDGPYDIAIDGLSPTDGVITLPTVSGTESHHINLLNAAQDVVVTAPLYVTFLPIVEMRVAACNTSSFTTGSIRVTDPEAAGYDSTYIAAYRYRGASSTGYAKKNYAVKLRDADGASVDRKFLDLRSDNNWILDAMAIDHACMRNRVATDLWNDFSTPPYHRREGWEKKARNGTRGKFVEVFLNGNYHGLYCMTEKVDRKQLKLKKYVPAVAATNTTEAATDTIHGTLYKGAQWSYEVLMGHDTSSETLTKTAPRSYDNTSKSDSWAGYEVKYPDVDDERIDWSPLWNAVNFVATSDDTEFDNNIGAWFDFPVVTDYYLFLELIFATDNNGKNVYFYNYDIAGEKDAQMMGLAPWDLDGTWGRNWDGTNSATGAEQSYLTLTGNRKATHTLFLRLFASTYWNWENQLRNRYIQLRNTYFDEAALTQRFTDYERLFVESGADLREEKAWSQYHTDITDDVDYIRDWIHSRLTYLDNQYDFATSLHDLRAATPHLTAIGGKGTLTLHTTQPATVDVYTVSGALVRRVTLSQPVTTLEGLDGGIYLVEGEKVLVR